MIPPTSDATVAKLPRLAPQPWNATLPNLGVGLGYREPLRADLFLNRDAVDFLEITADHFFQAPPEKEAELDLLAEHFTLIPHGLNLSLGSAEGLDEECLGRFGRLVERLQPPWWSEHIAFTRAGGVAIGHLTPLPLTWEAVEVLVRNIRRARAHIPAPLILENITYTIQLPGAELSEAQFISEVLERTDTGLLLDVTNLFSNAANHGYDPGEFLDGLPLERVTQLHFVGGFQVDGRWVDSHSEATPEPIWSLLDQVVKRAPVRGIVLERDENLPSFAELSAELRRAREILCRRQPCP